MRRKAVISVHEDAYRCACQCHHVCWHLLLVGPKVDAGVEHSLIASYTQRAETRCAVRASAEGLPEHLCDDRAVERALPVQARLQTQRY